MLRVDGLRVPLRKKQEEVRDAQKRALDLIDVSQFHTIKYDLATKERELQQEELLKEAVLAGDEAKKKVDELELKVKDLQADLRALEGADKENANLRQKNSELTVQLTNIQAAHKKELNEELSRLITENEADCEERMKLAWGLIHPDSDFDYFNLRYLYASEVYEARVLGTPAPPPFDEWAEKELGSEPDGVPMGNQPEQLQEQTAETQVGQAQGLEQPQQQEQQQD